MALSHLRVVRQHLPGVPRLHARAGAAVGDHGDRRGVGFTHDSIGVGEDGPTHQPIEHLATLRAIPGLDTIRPGDANEVAAAWKAIVSDGEHPTALILSRQALPTLDRAKYASADGVAKGGYVLADSDDPASHPDRDRLRSVARGRRVREAEGRRRRRARRLDAELVPLRKAGPTPTRNRCCRKTVTRAPRDRDGRARSAGTAMSGSTGKTITMSTFGASAPLAKLAGQVRLHRRQCREGRREIDCWRTK